MSRYSGKFIVFEGLDGSGQTTQAGLLKEWYDKAHQLAYYTKEPTEGPWGSILRNVLSHRIVSAKWDAEYEPIDEHTLALSFAADRMDHLNNEIIPKLNDGVVVICDRYYLSSFAYQRLDADFEWIRTINSKALRPDLTIFLDVPAVVCKRRMHKQRWHVELYEQLSKLELVHANYHKAIETLKSEGENIAIINGNQSIDEVHKEIVDTIKRFDMRGKEIANGSESVQLSFMSVESLTREEIALLDMG